MSWRSLWPKVIHPFIGNHHFQTQDPWNLAHNFIQKSYPLPFMRSLLFAGACHSRTACGSRTASRRTRRSWGVGRERAASHWPVCWRNSRATTKVSHTRNCCWALRFCCITCQISPRLLLFFYSIFFFFLLPFHLYTFYLCYVELCLIVLFVCVCGIRGTQKAHFHFMQYC